MSVTSKAGAAVFDEDWRDPADDDRDMPTSEDSPPPADTAAPPHRDMLPCARCRAANPAGLKFCAACGEPLWEPCAHCGAVCAAGQRFCGACGANLAAAIHQQTEQFEMTLVTVERLRADARYEEAVALLGPMSGMIHPRLAHHAKTATELIKRLGAERQAGLGQGEDACQQARLRLAEQDYLGTIRLLDSVPAALRNDDCQALLAEARQRQREVVALGEELRAALAEKRAAGVLPKVARLLELKPGHAQARQLAEQLQARYVQAARAKLAGHQYEDAARLLAEMPESVQNAATAALRGDVDELSWLAWDLRSAPVVDETLLAAAERLRKLSPADPRAGKLREEMQRRLRAANKMGTGSEHANVCPTRNDRREVPVPILFAPPPPWAPAPATTALGCPLDWLGGLKLRFVPGESLEAADLAAHPGCFAVACGLALQGLRQARVELNLRPADRQNAIAKVAQLFRQRPAAWGLDLGSSSLKAVKLSWPKKQAAALIDAAAVIDYKKPLNQAAGEEEERGLLKEALMTLLAQHPVKGEQVCLGVPGRTVLTRLMRLPPADRGKMSAMVQFEAKGHLPVRLEQLVWDFQELAGEEDAAAEPAAPQRVTPVLLAATRRGSLDKRLDLLEDVGLRADVVQSECIAMYNFMMFQESRVGQANREAGGASVAGPASASGGPLRNAASICAAPPETHATSTHPTAKNAAWPAALLDIGGDGSHLVIGSSTGFWVRHLGFGGYTVTRALVQQFKLTSAEAERWKRNPALAPSFSAMYRALRPLFDDLAEELGHALAAYAQTDCAQPVRQILTAGGGACLHGLLAHLRSPR